MSSRDPAGYGEGHSKKGRLSFLLNHDDVDNRPQGSHNHFGADGDVPMVSERVRGSGSSSSKRGSYRSSGRGLGSTSLPMPSIGAERATHFERSQPSRISSANDTVGSEKRGVRKKRQRKFICDRCNFGFYTNSDLQKVRCCFLHTLKWRRTWYVTRSNTFVAWNIVISMWVQFISF